MKFVKFVILMEPFEIFRYKRPLVIGPSSNLQFCLFAPCSVFLYEEI